MLALSALHDVMIYYNPEREPGSLSSERTAVANPCAPAFPAADPRTVASWTFGLVGGGDGGGMCVVCVYASVRASECVMYVWCLCIFVRAYTYPCLCILRQESDLGVPLYHCTPYWLETGFPTNYCEPGARLIDRKPGSLFFSAPFSYHRNSRKMGTPNAFCVGTRNKPLSSMLVGLVLWLLEPSFKS